MAWIDDRIWCHQKTGGLSGNAARAWMFGLAYASGNLTQGKLNTWQLKLVQAGKREVDELVGAGLWERNGDGVVIHDWDAHNGKRDARRAADRERKRREREGTKL